MAASSIAPQDRRSARAPSQASASVNGAPSRDIPVPRLNSPEAIAAAELPEWLSKQVLAKQSALTKLNAASEQLGFDLVLRVRGARCALAALPKAEGPARDQMPMGAPLHPDAASPLHDPIKHLIHCFKTVLVEQRGQEQVEAQRRAGREHHRLATAVGAQAVNARPVLTPAASIPAPPPSTEQKSARKPLRM